MLLWITLTLVVLALAAVRYGADSRDGLDRNPFAPVGSTASEAPRAPAAGHRPTRTPADDLAALARALSDAERAALALAECVTRLADRPDPVPDAVWDDAADHYDEKVLSSLLVSIGAINVWNRLNAAIREPVPTTG